jgi:hypothetical protein
VERQREDHAQTSGGAGAVLALGQCSLALEQSLLFDELTPLFRFLLDLVPSVQPTPHTSSPSLTCTPAETTTTLTSTKTSPHPAPTSSSDPTLRSVLSASACVAVVSPCVRALRANSLQPEYALHLLDRLCVGASLPTKSTPHMHARARTHTHTDTGGGWSSVAENLHAGASVGACTLAHALVTDGVLSGSLACVYGELAAELSSQLRSGARTLHTEHPHSTAGVQVCVLCDLVAVRCVCV